MKQNGLPALDSFRSVGMKTFLILLDGEGRKYFIRSERIIEAIFEPDENPDKAVTTITYRNADDEAEEMGFEGKFAIDALQKLEALNQ